MKHDISDNFAFYEQLRLFYEVNRRKIRSRYNDLTKKFLAYNDREENTRAFLRPPQFEALEMYVFIKEFLDNAQVFKIFDDWRNRRDDFSEASYYSIRKDGQHSLFDYAQTKKGERVYIPEAVEKQTDTLFKQMKKYKEDYPNYIYALTMGLGKTILMATCIFYEFLLARKYPKDNRFCHNALVFAPDKTVLQSLREIITFDKSKVVPPEYVKVLDPNIKFHFLEESGLSLTAIGDSDYNIIISNTQKIIVKKKRKEDKPVDTLFKSGSRLSELYSEDELDRDDSTLIENQRFKRLCRLPQLGVYVDEAHHLFGADLEKQIRSADGKKTSLRDTINMLAKSTSIVACYNYTGTPYVNKQLLPEVVYAYGLKESIRKDYLKDVSLKWYENVKNVEFLRAVVTNFWQTYGDKTYEGLLPKLAIFASTIKEATDEVRPAVENILADIDVPTSKILVNVGDEKITKDGDIRNFNDLDMIGTVGSQMQILILVGKGREGWNCRSLFGVAMFRSPKSKIFVLQATMRCLRKITAKQETASVYLSKENYDILDEELNKNFNMEIKDLARPASAKTQVFKVRVLPPPIKIMLKRTWHEYTLKEKDYSTPLDFELVNADISKYSAILHEKARISNDMSVKEINIDFIKEQRRYSLFSLVGEIARYLNISCVFTSKILSDSKDGEATILEAVNKHNEVIYDIVVPRIYNALFELKSEFRTEDRELILLREPKGGEGFYNFSAEPDMVVKHDNPNLRPEEKNKSFHADIYCFDSKPEKECFWQYVSSDKVKRVYFTGMFTSNQGDLSIHYYDPESRRIRQYYPDFYAEMSDGSCQLIEVKRDDKIDDTVVRAKAEAALEMTTESNVKYLIYPASMIMKTNILGSSQPLTRSQLQLDC